MATGTTAQVCSTTANAVAAILTPSSGVRRDSWLVERNTGYGAIDVFLADDNLIVREGVPGAHRAQRRPARVVGVAADSDGVAGCANAGPQVLDTGCDGRIAEPSGRRSISSMLKAHVIRLPNVRVAREREQLSIGV